MEEHFLKRIQETELEILIEIKKICEKYNLRYYLAGGTLLGAVRHQGFIPWDDDIDICLLRDDYNKFIDLCKNGNVLSNNYFMQHVTTDRHYYNPYIKIRKRNTIFEEPILQGKNRPKEIYIDIFPFDYVKKNSGIIYNLKFKILSGIEDYVFGREMKIERDSLIKKLACCFFAVLPSSCYLKLWDRLAGSARNGEYITKFSGYGMKETMRAEVIKPATKVIFENEQFDAPHIPEKYLENIFGNWQELPPPEQRINHRVSAVCFDTRTEEIIHFTE